MPKQAAPTLATRSTVLLAEAKLELGLDDEGRLVPADDVLTPDSARFWAADVWYPGGPQRYFDKQFVRDSLMHDFDWDRVGPPQTLPSEVIAATRRRYLEAFERPTGEAFSR